MNTNSWNETWGTIDWSHDFEEDVMEKIDVFYLSGVDMNMQNEYGLTPLMLAADYGRRNLVDMLASFDANVNAQNKHGSTALHYAVWHGYADVVKVLIDAEANPNIRNSDGNRAIDLTYDQRIRNIILRAIPQPIVILSEEDTPASVFDRQYE